MITWSGQSGVPSQRLLIRCWSHHPHSSPFLLFTSLIIFMISTWSGQSGVPSQRLVIGRQVPSLQVSEDEEEQLD